MPKRELVNKAASLSNHQHTLWSRTGRTIQTRMDIDLFKVIYGTRPEDPVEQDEWRKALESELRARSPYYRKRAPR